MIREPGIYPCTDPNCVPGCDKPVYIDSHGIVWHRRTVRPNDPGGVGADISYTPIG